MEKDSGKRPPARKPTRNLRRAADEESPTRAERGPALILPASVRRAIANRRPQDQEQPSDAPDARVNTTTRPDGG